MKRKSVIGLFILAICIIFCNNKEFKEFKDLEVQKETTPEIKDRLSAIDRIMEGDFQVLQNDEKLIEKLTSIYEREKDIYGLTWIQSDLNGDGIEDLILQEEDVNDDSQIMKPILAVFACTSDNIRCIDTDFDETTFYDFFSPAGKLISYQTFSGKWVWRGLHYYKYNENWEKQYVYRLEYYFIESLNEFSNEEIKEYNVEWKEKFGIEFQVGEYYGILKNEDGNPQEGQYMPLTKDEFAKKYKELIGKEYEGL